MRVIIMIISIILTKLIMHIKILINANCETRIIIYNILQLFLIKGLFLRIYSCKLDKVNSFVSERYFFIIYPFF